MEDATSARDEKVVKAAMDFKRRRARYARRNPNQVKRLIQHLKSKRDAVREESRKTTTNLCSCQ